jgi:hypothetical protein
LRRSALLHRRAGVRHLPGRLLRDHRRHIPGNVIVCGRGKGVTTLVCKTAAPASPSPGPRRLPRHHARRRQSGREIGRVTGLNRLCHARSVEVKRFETGILWRGGSFHRYRDLWLANCTKNIRFLGDLNSSLGSTGGPFALARLGRRPIDPGDRHGASN